MISQKVLESKWKMKGTEEIIMIRTEIKTVIIRTERTTKVIHEVK